MPVWQGDKGRQVNYRVGGIAGADLGSGDSVLTGLQWGMWERLEADNQWS